MAGKHPLRDDPLVKIDAYGIAGESYYARNDGKNAPYNTALEGALPAIWCRREVALRLQQANAALAPLGLELFLYDAYRPIACQQGLWDFFISKARTELGGADEEAIETHVRKFISDPRAFKVDDPSTWPTHSTGGAVDLTLRNVKTGALLDMGAGFDEDSERSYTFYYEGLLRDGKIAQDHLPLLNRRMLYGAMIRAGFVNYPYECWHYDWGTQMYIRNARLYGTEAGTEAWYGYAGIR